MHKMQDYIRHDDPAFRKKIKHLKHVYCIRQYFRILGVIETKDFRRAQKKISSDLSDQVRHHRVAFKMEQTKIREAMLGRGDRISKVERNLHLWGDDKYSRLTRKWLILETDYETLLMPG